MESIEAALLAIAVFVIGVLGNLIASEVYDSSATLARWFLKRASRQLPERDRARYLEEWSAHLDGCPGKLAKLAHALGCFASARKLSIELRRALRSLRKSKEGREYATKIFKFSLRETYKKVRADKSLSINEGFYEEWERDNLEEFVKLFLSGMGEDSKQKMHSLLDRMNVLILPFSRNDS